ncbi:MAG: hypothetical protein MUF81_02640 [Verrucomicrobia bacterium]|jgi:hypothetical protein|nr:hypothetical protein [Verrucomicrobiota bacterium]
MKTPLLRKYFKSIRALCPAPIAVMLALVTVAWPSLADEPPDITLQPQSLALIASEDAQFSVTASGTEPLAYQWRFNGENMPGATEATNIVNYVQSHSAGEYDVVITNTAGAVTSTVATLTVEYPRVLVQPTNAWLSIAEGGVGGEVQFSVAPLPHPPTGYQWRFNGADIRFETSSNLIIRIQSVTNAGDYSVFVKTTWGGTEGPATKLEVFTVEALREEWRTNVTPGNVIKPLTDADGNLYLAANISSAGFNVVKVDKAGRVLWNTNFKTPPCHCDEVSAMALDALGNLYVTGFSPLNAAGTEQGYLTAKFNTSGSNCWSAIYTGPRSGSLAKAIAVDAGGNVYVTGISTGPTNVYSADIATVKYDTSGALEWVQRFDSGLSDIGYAIALDSQTNVIITGDSTTIKYNSDGTQLWRSSEYGKKIVIDPNDDVFLADERPLFGTSYVPLMKLSKTNGHGHFRLTLTGEPRVPVWLKASTTLWDWLNLSTLQFSVATADYTDAEAATLPHRFYRTVSVAPPSP